MTNGANLVTRWVWDAVIMDPSRLTNKPWLLVEQDLLSPKSGLLLTKITKPSIQHFPVATTLGALHFLLWRSIFVNNRLKMFEWLIYFNKIVFKSFYLIRIIRAFWTLILLKSLIIWINNSFKTWFLCDIFSTQRPYLKMEQTESLVIEDPISPQSTSGMIFYQAGNSGLFCRFCG